MHLRTILVLLLSVAVLGGLAWLVQGREELAAETGAERALVPGLEYASIEELRVDNLERGLQMTLRRDDEGGGWDIVDPLVYPADGALLKLLMDALVLNRAEPWEGELGALALDPPRVVVEVSVRGDAGRPRRIEVGGVDVDRQHVFVRVDGVLLRTLRNLDTTLERDLHEWRDRLLLGISPGSIVELRRHGRLPPVPGAEPEDLTLEAVNDGGWRATRPYQVALAPEGIGPLLTTLAYLRVDGYEDDAPTDLALYGLDPAELTLEVSTVQGERHVVRLSRAPGGGRFLLHLEGSPHVYSLKPESLSWLLAPTDMLVDREIARTVRERVRALCLVADGRETRLESRGFSWYLGTGEPGAEIATPRLADSDMVSDLLGAIESARVLELLPDVEWPASGEVHGVYLEVEGERMGGEIGPAYASPLGTEGRLFRRLGDTLVGLVDAELLEVARADPDSLRSLVLHRVSELDLVQAKVEAPFAGVRRTWTRDADGRWRPEGSEGEARDFAALVDRLLTVRATRFAEPGEVFADETGTVGVRLLDVTGETRAAFLLSLLAGQAEDPAGARILYQSSEVTAEVDGRLYFPLLELLGVP